MRAGIADGDRDTMFDTIVMTVAPMSAPDVGAEEKVVRT